MSAIELPVIIMLVLYAALLFAWIIFSTSISSYRTTAKSDHSFTVSIIIPVCNERNRIIDCLRSVIDAVRELNGVEVIVSDDHSEDDTCILTEEFINESHESGVQTQIRMIRAAKDDKKGKKAALERAILTCESEIILTTDADCSFSKGWVESMVSPYAQGDVKMVAGPVTFNSDGTFLSIFQLIEQAILTNISRASIQIGSPLICNGANLSFRRSAFFQVDGYYYGREFPGGDDTYLMLAFNRHFPDSIRFCAEPQSEVISLPAKEFSSYINQRVRHGKKVAGYREKYIVFTGILTSMVNMMLLPLLVLGIFGVVHWQFLIGWLVAKTSTDLLFGIISLSKIRQLNYGIWVIPASIVFSLFTWIIIMRIFFVRSLEWKGRKY